MRTTNNDNSQLKVLKGQYHEVNGIKWPTTDIIPDPPSDFNKEAKALFTEICEHMRAKNNLQPIFIHWIEILCRQYNLYKHALNDIEQSGQILTYQTRKGEKQKKNPSLEIINETLESIKDISVRFGIDPLVRSRIKA